MLGGGRGKGFTPREEDAEKLHEENAGIPREKYVEIASEKSTESPPCKSRR